MGSDVATFSGGSASHNSNDAQSQLRDTKDGWRPSDKIAAMPGNSGCVHLGCADGAAHVD